MKHIAIAGGGFAGVRLARKLRMNKQVTVTLINENEDFRYSPALYRAATGFKMGIARIPLEWMLLDSRNVSLVVDRVEKLDNDNKTLVLASGAKIKYDYVVFALGATTSYFGIEGLDKHAYGIKSFDEIIKLKHHIHDGLVDKPHERDNFVIVGAGPTGSELAGALGSYVRRILKKHNINSPSVTITLVEAGPRILPQISEKAAKKVHKRLEKLGITILCNTMVKSETLHTLKTTAGSIKTENVIWTAGTTNSPFFKQYEDLFKIGSRSRVTVNEHLEAFSDTYVCGDNADTPYSGLALTAINHANFLAKDITARTSGKSRPTFKPKHPVKIVPVGNRWSIFEYRWFVFSSWPASILRRGADIVGYTDILGPIKALTIWKNSDRVEYQCMTCRRR